MRLLIADDENLTRQGLRAIAWGEIGVDEVIEAANGAKALESIAKFKPEIILADIQMPGLTGLELAKIVEENKYPSKIILLSGYGRFEYARKAIRYNVFEYLLKPSSIDEICMTVKRVIAQILAEQHLAKRKAYELSQNAILENTDKGLVCQILDYIEKHHAEEITLQEVADYVHISPVYCCKIIKKETSYNFLYILNLYRMLKAAELITETDEKIFMICEKVGIPDQRYFSKLFKKAFGMTPLQYRKEATMIHKTSLLNAIK